MANHQFKAISIKIRFHEMVCNNTPELLIMLYLFYNMILLLLININIYLYILN